MKSPFAKFIGLIAAAGLIYAATIFYLDWRMPRATAMIQIHSSYFIGQPTSGSDVTGEIENVLTRETLAMAATSLGIEQSLRKELILMMKNSTAKHDRVPDMISITVKDKNPQKAAKIANAIAEAYAQRRATITTLKADKILSIMDIKMAAQNALVSEHRKDLERILHEYGLKIPIDNNSFLKPSELPPHLDCHSVDYALRNHSYLQAVEDFIRSRDLFHDMQSKQEEVRILLNKRPFQPVTIHKFAK